MNFEYKAHYFRIVSAEARENDLNILAIEGWELVAVDNGWAYLRRPKQP